MSASRNRARDMPVRRYAVAIVAMAAGAGLLCLAAPIAMAAFAGIPGNLIVKRLHAETADGPALLRLARSREASLTWREKSRTWAELGLARVMLGSSGAGPAQTVQFSLAEDALGRALALAPMNPRAWTRLVLVRVADERPATEIARPLSLALATGPHEDQMDRVLLEAGLLSWRELDDHDRDRIAARARREWQRNPSGAASVATRAGKLPLFARLVGLDGTPHGPWELRFPETGGRSSGDPRED